jgi:hypothetical protein
MSAVEANIYADENATAKTLPAGSDLGAIIPSAKGRRIAYSAFALLSLIVSNVAIAFSSLGEPLPGWLVASIAVAGSLSVPFAALAVANAKNTNA